MGPRRQRIHRLALWLWTQHPWLRGPGDEHLGYEQVEVGGRTHHERQVEHEEEHLPLWLPQALNQALRRQCTFVGYVQAEQ